MARVGAIDIHLDDGQFRAVPSDRTGYIQSAWFCALTLETPNGRPIAAIYFNRADLAKVEQIAALLNEIAGNAPGDDARRGVISPRSRPAALPDVGAGEA